MTAGLWCCHADHYTSSTVHFSQWRHSASWATSLLILPCHFWGLSAMSVEGFHARTSTFIVSRTTQLKFSVVQVSIKLTKYSKSISRVFGSTCTKICINFVAMYRFISFLHETRSPFYDAQSASTRNILNLSCYCTRKVGFWRNKCRMLFRYLLLLLWTSQINYTYQYIHGCW